ncbi:GntR family transcriptional regulator [Paenibacillus sp. N4]|uniref:substrate-binding domain-containing protein n=1 Tax=Paenibacillus vietnamensis TaxID=2590547 RepID=UPI001CD05AD4|nr:GntR family transcriptional regulator [Paenibacillus vietnamensis]MCA0755950.1 GntR family transcriptional regulator [Paenibacillus vietnamensis]
MKQRSIMSGRPAPERASAFPLYMQVSGETERIIRERGLKPHDPVPSEGELARLFGVSRMTAKLALDELAGRGRVYRLARRGTFLAEAAPRGADIAEEPENALRSELRIAFIVSNLDYYTSKIVSALEAEARRNRFSLTIKLSKDIADEDDCLLQLAGDGVDGILLFPRGRQACGPALSKLLAERYPIVGVDRLVPGADLDCVLHDHFQGAYDMVASLIAAGHTEIGFVTNPLAGVSSIEDRYQAYMKALYDHNIPIQSQYIHTIEKSNQLTDYSAGDPLLERFLEEYASITALMCGDDYLAASVIYSAIRIGREVPGRLSVAGFTDAQLATMLPVPLTTVSQPVGELAEAAVKLLLDRIGGSDEPFSTIKIKTKITERQSVARCLLSVT